MSPLLQSRAVSCSSPVLEDEGADLTAPRSAAKLIWHACMPHARSCLMLVAVSCSWCCDATLLGAGTCSMASCRRDKGKPPLFQSSSKWSLAPASLMMCSGVLTAALQCDVQVIWIQSPASPFPRSQPRSNPGLVAWPTMVPCRHIMAQGCSPLAQSPKKVCK